MKKRYSEEQIIGAIKQHESGAKVDDICRDMGISVGTFYNLAQQVRRLGGERSQAAQGATE